MTAVHDVQYKKLYFVIVNTNIEIYYAWLCPRKFTRGQKKKLLEKNEISKELLNITLSMFIIKMDTVICKL